jgi:hypothetical protein
MKWERTAPHLNGQGSTKPASRWCGAGTREPQEESPAHLLLWCRDQRVVTLRGQVAPVEDMKAVVTFFQVLEQGP